MPPTSESCRGVAQTLAAAIALRRSSASLDAAWGDITATMTRSPVTINATLTTLVVLAGGRGRRMAGPKSRLEYGGRPALAWILDRLAWPGPTLLVTAPSNRAPPGCERFDAEATDPEDDGGPLLGLRTGLAHASTPWALFVPVDMPLLRQPELRELLDAAAADPAGRGRMGVRQLDGAATFEPFPAAIPTRARDAIDRHWASGARSLRSLLDVGLCATHDASHWPARGWLNVNVPADLDACRQAIASGE